MGYLTDKAIKEKHAFSLFALVFSDRRQGEPFSIDDIVEECDEVGIDMNRSDIAMHIAQWLDDNLLDRSERGHGIYQVVSQSL